MEPLKFRTRSLAAEVSSVVDGAAVFVARHLRPWAQRPRAHLLTASIQLRDRFHGICPRRRDYDWTVVGEVEQCIALAVVAGPHRPAEFIRITGPRE